MQLSNLPGDILLAVFGQYLSSDGDAVTKFKGSLPLLAVCRQWRHLLIPMVYRQAFVQYGARPTFGVGRITRNPNIEEPIDVAVKTNLDLIVGVGYVSAVRSIHIVVNCFVNPFPGWQEVIRRMRAVANTWRAVELYLEIYPHIFHFDNRTVDMSKYAGNIAEVGNALLAFMPDVRRLYCKGLNHNSIAKALYERLAKHYASQLQQLDSDHPLVLPPDYQFTKMQEITIDYEHDAEYQLPRMTSGELVRMRLDNAPPNHSWAPFSTSNASRVIEFTKLEKLVVSYDIIYEENGSAVHHRDGQPWVLQFPRLTRLAIRNTEDICPLLKYAALPSCMDSISIDMPSATFQSVADVVLPATKRLLLAIPRSATGDPSGLPTINRLLKRACGSESLELSIEDVRLAIDPVNMTSAALTSLFIAGPVSADSMFVFLARMPRLVKLMLFTLDVRDIQADISIPDVDDSAVVGSLSTSLEELELIIDSQDQLPDVEMAVVKCVLLRIPTLTKFNALWTPEEPVLEFVRAYSGRYSHLGSVDLALRK
ncbi:hypothetical protein H4R19_000886 [Coemansia spiralis]|nr:hypothetical protein H4R19_000886 [Coemansia spiralis]